MESGWSLWRWQGDQGRCLSCSCQGFHFLHLPSKAVLFGALMDVLVCCGPPPLCFGPPCPPVSACRGAPLLPPALARSPVLWCCRARCVTSFCARCLGLYLAPCVLRACARGAICLHVRLRSRPHVRPSAAIACRVCASSHPSRTPRHCRRDNQPSPPTHATTTRYVTMSSIKPRARP